MLKLMKLEVGLQKYISFAIKASQLKEIIEVKNCLLVLDASCSGKTLFYINSK